MRGANGHRTSDRTSGATATTADPAGPSETAAPERTFESEESIEIDADVHRVFAHWSRVERFPRMLQSVRRTKRIDEGRVLWDVDILGHQVVWESTVEEIVPRQLIRWRSTWGARNTGEVRFDPLPGARTRLTVQIAYRPKGLLERLGAHLRLVDLHLRRDLARFKAIVERLPAEEPVEWPASKAGRRTRPARMTQRGDPNRGRDTAGGGERIGARRSDRPRRRTGTDRSG